MKIRQIILKVKLMLANNETSSANPARYLFKYWYLAFPM